MPKISSRLDHNKSKQIRVELRATSQKPEGKRSRKHKKKDHNKIFAVQTRKFRRLRNLPPATVHLSYHCSPFLLFNFLTFLLHFLFLPNLSLVIDFAFGFF